MQSYLPLLFDAAIVLLFIFNITKGMRRGLLRVVAELFSTLGAILIAAVGSAAVATPLYDSLFQGSVLRMLDSYLADAASPELMLQQVETAIENLPAIVRGAVESGLGTLTLELEQLMQLDIEEVARAVADSVIAPMVISVLEMLLFFLFFVLACYVLRLFCRALNVLNHIPLVGPLNSLLGAAFGALQAVAVLSLLVVVGEFVILATENSLEFLNSDLIASTMFCRYFVEHNLVTWALGLLK